jgi:hypothetical protein
MLGGLGGEGDAVGLAETCYGAQGLRGLSGTRLWRLEGLRWQFRWLRTAEEDLPVPPGLRTSGFRGPEARSVVDMDLSSLLTHSYFGPPRFTKTQSISIRALQLGPIERLGRSDQWWVRNR